VSRLGQGARRVLICGLVVGFVAVLLLASFGAGADPGTWKKYRRNPVFDIGAAGAWDQGAINSVNVIKDGTIFRMYYAGCTGVVCGIGLATSKDGIDWIRYPDNPVVPPGIYPEWSYIIQNPSVMKDGDTYRMWFSANDLVSQIRIGYATSADGLTWAVHPRPVLVGDLGAWDAASVSTPAVIREGAGFTMWYSGHSGDFIYRMGRAVSLDGIGWAKDSSNPVSSPNFGWEDSRVHPMQILAVDGAYEMYYYAGFSYVVIGHAISADGLTWTRSPDAPILSPGPAGSWDAASLGVCTVVQVNHRRMMWYSGSDGAVRRIGLAISAGYR